ncbi:MAG: 3'-5' exonuclease [Croceimicrobium sp.]|nr:3'-5' exonuclease [Bacteroidota bacterium]
MISPQQIQQILFLDIETVSAHSDFEQMDAEWQELWNLKTRFQRQDESPEEFYPKRAGILAEFGKVVCISCAFISNQNGHWELRMKSFSGEDEAALLLDFANLLERLPNFRLCAHNGKEFDFPYLSRRMISLGIKLPGQLNNAGKKPWEVPHIDTMELWKFGDYKSFTSLRLLAALFNIPTPKDDIDGSMVGDVYWKENDLNRIRVYCEKDVLTLVKVFLKISQSDVPADMEVLISDSDQS